MQWGSVENFLAMGGYGFYVWGSYLVCARSRRALADARAFAARGAAKGV
jgi:heme exporter protein D